MIEHRDYTTRPPMISSHPRDQRCAECAPRSTGNRMSNMTRIDREERVFELKRWFQDQSDEFGTDGFTPEVQSAWDNHKNELARHEAILDQLATRDQKLRDYARNGGAYESGDGRNPYQSGEVRINGDHRGKALRAIDQLERMPDAAREYATKEIEQDKDIDQRLARVTAALAHPDYFRAFSKWHNDPLTGAHLWSPQERIAVNNVKYLERSFGLGAQGGGFMVPFELDPSVILANTGSVDPMRSVARVTTSAYNVKKFVSSVGSTASWDPEFQEVSDDSPTLLQPEVTCFKGATYIQHSYELLEDSDIAQQVGKILADSKAQLESTAFTTGTGTAQPWGLINRLVNLGGSIVIATASNVLANTDPVNNQNALPPRWRPRAQFMANLSVINGYRQLIKATGLTESLVDDSTSPPRIFGWKIIENSAMDGLPLTGAAADYSLVSGDFNQYAIVDRIGSSIVPVPVVIGATRRPTGEYGWYLHWRTGADVLVGDAFRLSNFST
jgi:HK97 family phage major capsid protein